MKVFVTGATGFLGSHIATELLQAGHTLRLLVRDIDRAWEYFADYHRQIERFVEVDMLDRDAVKDAIEGCDAVVHAAAMVSLDHQLADQVYRTNIEGTRSVIGGALECGIPNIIHVSSYSVLFNPGAASISEESPLCNFREAYIRSKRDSEVWVREQQQAGAPIQITYPSGVMGPDDPRLSETNKALVGYVKGAIPNTGSGTVIVDVRDVATMHRFLVEHPPGGEALEHRYLMAGHYFSWTEFRELLQLVVGREIRAPRMPGWLLRFIGSCVDLLRKFRTIDSPISKEAMVFVTQCVPAQSDRITRRTGIEYRQPIDTVRETVQWSVEQGHLRARQDATAHASLH